jgi:hypothetical protein
VAVRTREVPVLALAIAEILRKRAVLTPRRAVFAEGSAVTVRLAAIFVRDLLVFVPGQQPLARPRRILVPERPVLASVKVEATASHGTRQPETGPLRLELAVMDRRAKGETSRGSGGMYVARCVSVG